MSDSTHLFALFVDNLYDRIDFSESSCVIDDALLMHRITHVLRLQESENICFFDVTVHVYAKFVSTLKKELLFHVISIQKNKIFEPTVMFYLPLLKRESLEEAVYAITEAGVSEIQLVRTHKSRQSIKDHELQRLLKIIVAAAEQSKNFILPLLKSPLLLEDILGQAQGEKVWFDVTGGSIVSLINKVSLKKSDMVSIIIGPEADFTLQEKSQLSGVFSCYGLTPTVLRSVTAATLAVGIVRSL